VPYSWYEYMHNGTIRVQYSSRSVLHRVLPKPEEQYCNIGEGSEVDQFKFRFAGDAGRKSRECLNCSTVDSKEG
jgi:hypothetical protein